MFGGGGHRESQRMARRRHICSSTLHYVTSRNVTPRNATAPTASKRPPTAHTTSQDYIATPSLEPPAAPRSEQLYSTGWLVTGLSSTHLPPFDCKTQHTGKHL